MNCPNHHKDFCDCYKEARKKEESNKTVSAKMPFGKHKGSLISEIDDAAYLKWIRGNKDIVSKLNIYQLKAIWRNIYWTENSITT